MAPRNAGKRKAPATLAVVNKASTLVGRGVRRPKNPPPTRGKENLRPARAAGAVVKPNAKVQVTQGVLKKAVGALALPPTACNHAVFWCVCVFLLVCQAKVWAESAPMPTSPPKKVGEIATLHNTLYSRCACLCVVRCLRRL
jgi:hypothetical protein